MKLIALAFFLVSSMKTFAGIYADVVLVSVEDVRAGKAPVLCSMKPRGEANVGVTVTLKQPFGVPGTFGGIEFRIMPETIDHTNLKASVWDINRIERRGRTREKSFDFQLSRDEVRRCLVIVDSWTGPKDGMNVVRSACVPLAALVPRGD